MLYNRKQELCERINELDLQIDFAKRFDLDYSNLIVKRNTLIRELDRGVINETSSKKKSQKTKNRRLF